MKQLQQLSYMGLYCVLWVCCAGMACGGQPAAPVSDAQVQTAKQTIQKYFTTQKVALPTVQLSTAGIDRQNCNLQYARVAGVDDGPACTNNDYLKMYQSALSGHEASG